MAKKFYKKQKTSQKIGKIIISIVLLVVSIYMTKQIVPNIYYINNKTAQINEQLKNIDELEAQVRSIKEEIYDLSTEDGAKGYLKAVNNLKEEGEDVMLITD